MGTKLLSRFARGFCDLIQSSCLRKYDKLNLEVNHHLFRYSSSHGDLWERTDKEKEGLKIIFLHTLSWNLRDNILKSNRGGQILFCKGHVFVSLGCENKIP